MMVVSVLAVATIMAFVMLSSATLQSRAGANQAKLASAEYLAESGINIAMYYLQYPDRAPLVNADGYWPGTTSDLEMGDGLTLGIGVTRDPADDATYEVTTTATVGALEEHRITRTTGAKLYVRNQFEVTKAAAFNSDTQISAGTIVSGDVWSSRNLAIRTGSPLPAIYGYGYCKTSSVGALFLLPSKGYRSASPPSPGAPTAAQINLYQTYKHNDTFYTAATLSGSTLSTGTLLGPTPNNPAAIYFGAGTIQVDSDVTINGTLVIDGVLTVRGSNIVINPQPGYPALIVTGILDIDRTLKSLTVNGTTFVGTQVRASGAIPTAANMSKLKINGGLLIGAETGAPFPTSGYTIATSITYDAALAKPIALKTPRGVSIVRWGPP